jgi:hypothetical protein
LARGASLTSSESTPTSPSATIWSRIFAIILDDYNDSYPPTFRWVFNVHINIASTDTLSDGASPSPSVTTITRLCQHFSGRGFTIIFGHYNGSRSSSTPSASMPTMICLHHQAWLEGLHQYHPHQDLLHHCPTLQL